MKNNTPEEVKGGQPVQRTAKSHSFSIILIMIVLMLVGAACIPLLNVQYQPLRENLNLSIGLPCRASKALATGLAFSSFSPTRVRAPVTSLLR